MLSNLIVRAVRKTGSEQWIEWATIDLREIICDARCCVHSTFCNLLVVVSVIITGAKICLNAPCYNREIEFYVSDMYSKSVQSLLK